MNRYFYCYSYPLKTFLRSNGLRYVAASINMNTKKKYLVFENTEELNELFDVWKIENINIRRCL